MALLADRVKETTTTTGTGQLTLAGAPTGFQSFTTAFGNGASVYYVIAGGSDWEVGIGTTGAGTLTRDAVLQSSNGDALVDWGAGTKDVFCSYVADRAVTTSDAATLTNKTIDSITNSVGSDHLHVKVKATEALAKGDILKATGWNSGENAVEVAKVASASDVAFAIAYQALNNGDLGAAINTGIITGLNTNAYTVGTILYPNTSGGLTSSKPTSGTYQAVAIVLRQGSANGVLYTEFTETQEVSASTNTGNTIVLRDASGNFSAGTITAALSGNASTATALQTARTINGTSFDGTANITVTAAAGTLTGTTLNSTVVSSSLTSVGTLTSGAIGTGFTAIPNTALANSSVTINGTAVALGASATVTAAAGTLSGTSLAANVVSSSLTSVGTLTNLTVTNTITGSVSGNAGTATTLANTRTIWGQNFNGSANVTGTLSMADEVISRPRFTDYAETYTTPAISSGTLTLNLENGNVFRTTRNANISTLTISNPAGTGNACSFTLIFDANGTSYTITWPAAVKWPGGTAPTITTTNGRSDMFVFYTNNAGTTWYAMTAAQNFVTS